MKRSLCGLKNNSIISLCNAYTCWLSFSYFLWILSLEKLFAESRARFMHLGWGLTIAVASHCPKMKSIRLENFFHSIFFEFYVVNINYPIILTWLRSEPSMFKLFSLWFLLATSHFGFRGFDFLICANHKTAI